MDQSSPSINGPRGLSSWTPYQTPSPSLTHQIRQQRIEVAFKIATKKIRCMQLAVFAVLIAGTALICGGHFLKARSEHIKQLKKAALALGILSICIAYPLTARINRYAETRSELALLYYFNYSRNVDRLNNER